MPITSIPRFSPNNEISESRLEETNEHKNVKVLLRLKPCLDGDGVWNTSLGEGCISVENEFARLFRKSQISYTFDAIFDNKSTKSLYESSVRETIENAFDGVNALIFAYGQTCSGKTYTMLGNDQEPGIIYLALHSVFSTIEREKEKNSKFTLSYSYMEIYNDRIIDLLDTENSQKEVKLIEDKNGTKLCHLREETAESWSEIARVVRECENLRHIRETDFNERSSRSHSVFQMSLSKQTTDSRLAYTSTITMIDLAGSERASVAQVSAEKRRETTFINKSLLTLATVIGKLTDPKQKHTHIPYRDSKLTRLLQPILASLSANICIICNIRQERESFEESHRTLIFGQRMHNLELKPIVNVARVDKAYEDRQEILLLKRKIEKLKKELRQQAEQDCGQQTIQDCDQQAVQDCCRGAEQYCENGNLSSTLSCDNFTDKNSRLIESEKMQTLTEASNFGLEWENLPEQQDVAVALSVLKEELSTKDRIIQQLEAQIEQLQTNSRKDNEWGKKFTEQQGKVKMRSLRLELDQALSEFLH